MTDPTTSRAIALPMLIDGKRFGTGSTELTTIGGGRATMPAFTSAARDKLLSLDRGLLRDVPIQSIVSFLNRVGKNWRSEDYSRRRLFVRQLQTVMGYSELAAEHEADWIGAVLTSHSRMLDLINIELGSRFILDEWVRVEEALVRAFPLGLVAHILPGNVPASNILSVVRALITKNISVLKASSADPVTPVSFALSLLEVDPHHPVARAVNVVYWPEDDPLGDEVVRSADAVCAWGTAPAIEWARKRVSSDASFLPFGPKRSIALVGRDADWKAAALGLAHDVSTYDQAACFSVQRVFVEGDPEPLLHELTSAMSHYEELLPPRELSVDDLAYLNARRLDHVFGGGKVHSTAGRASVIVAPPDHTIESPLGRTLLVHPVEDLRAAYDHIDREVQTVAAAPWELLAEHRDAIAARGVSRFVDLGLANVFRVGGAHDGMRPLQRLVRFASQEAPVSEIPKGMVLKLDLTTILENKSFQDVIF
jgi:long-chain-fatty-acyl-CoA reductase